MCPIQVLDPMRSRAGQRVKARFYNGPTLKHAEVDKRYKLRIVGGFLSILGHRNKSPGQPTIPCLGHECRLCREGLQPEIYEYMGALLNGHVDEPVVWCVPPDWSHQLGEGPWRWLTFSTWIRRDGTVRIERSREPAAVIEYPEIDVWNRCLESWRLTEAQVGPRPTYEVPAPEPDVLKLPPPAPKITREEYERIAADRGFTVRKTGGA